jgi:hypothetical protein
MSPKVYLLSVVVVCLLGALSRGVEAQSEALKFEAGAQLSALRHSGSGYILNLTTDINHLPRDLTAPPKFITTGEPLHTDVGLGGRLTYNLNRHLAFEGELNFFPGDLLTAGSRTQALFGAKVGRRFRRFGIFAKARPGFIYFHRGRVAAPDVPGGFLTYPAKTVFAFDLGGVVEVYHSRRVFTRFDFGDTLIRPTTPVSFNGAPFMDVGLSFPRFQFSAGVGFRF